MKVGLIGTGKIARKMMETINGMEGVQVVGCYSHNFEHTNEFANQYEGVIPYEKKEELLSNKEIDFIYVSTPHMSHKKDMIDCINHSKAVLSEKPFTVNAKEAKEVFDLAKEKNVPVLDGMWTRYLPSRFIIDEIMKSGIIGDVKSFKCDLSYFIRNVRRIYDKSLAGGALLDIGVYCVNFALMHFGSDIKEIGYTVNFLDTGVDEAETINILYNNGILGTLTASVSVIGDRRAVISGSKGFMVVENVNNPQLMDIYDGTYNLIKRVEIPKQITGFEYEVMELMKMIENGKIESDIMPFSETIKLLETMDDLRRRWNFKYDFE